MLITIIKNVQVFDLMQQWWGWYELCGGFFFMDILRGHQQLPALASVWGKGREKVRSKGIRNGGYELYCESHAECRTNPWKKGSRLCQAIN